MTKFAKVSKIALAQSMTRKMTKYAASKTVLARPLTRKEYLRLREWELPEHENENDLGYLTVDPQGKPNVTGFDGYVSWLPADEFERTHKAEEATVKTLHNSDVSGARKNVKDIVVVGNGDMFSLLCKASSQAEGWMKSTKAMQTFAGCLVQVTTQQRNPDGSYAVAEALAFVPDVQIVSDENDGRKLL